MAGFAVTRGDRNEFSNRLQNTEAPAAPAAAHSPLHHRRRRRAQGRWPRRGAGAAARRRQGGGMAARRRGGRVGAVVGGGLFWSGRRRRGGCCKSPPRRRTQHAAAAAAPAAARSPPRRRRHLRTQGWRQRNGGGNAAARRRGGAGGLLVRSWVGQCFSRLRAAGAPPAPTTTSARPRRAWGSSGCCTPPGCWADWRAASKRPTTEHRLPSQNTAARGIAILQKLAFADRREAEPTTRRRNEVRLAVRQAPIQLLADKCRQ